MVAKNSVVVFVAVMLFDFCFFPTSAHAALTDGLVGWWTFDGSDITTSIVDRSGNGNNGGFVGGATSSAKVIGKLGQALNFGVADTAVLVPYVAALHPANITVSAWIKSTDVTSVGRVIVSSKE